ncbi:FAD-dependent monooxygenase [Streptomyces sp. H27-C3]|uniref:FAD-dependent monooxygenase n=1 Tax=Streptomyces sp. H27-C3 TaxID=3046305 RepID=UPI0024B95FDD|nr:FAD-dependent monooxygenase [Streptomyces sp. H27-C3]MDJ0466261.1 FAD-dependent monooxygenase [Streptomyces sp. H27-C3]
MTADVLVVGAGPAGLTLAAELRLGGAGVVVVDERPGPTTESRASTLHARTMEIFDSRDWTKHLGQPPRETRGHFGGLPLDLALPSTHSGQWKVAQTRTEEMLQEVAAGLGADLRRSHRLVSVTAADGEVAAETVGPRGRLRIRARYLVACDGEDSTVRRLTGADFPGRDATRELLRADVSGVDVADRRFQRLEHGLAIAATRHGTTRVMVHEFGRPPGVRDGTAPDFAEVCSAWKRVTGEDISHGTPLWLNAFGDANRQLSRYRHGRVLFAGDSAHRQMPSGGQALNLGIQDAFNLGWKLAAVVRGTAGDDLLDSYHTERHAVGRDVLANIRAQGHLLLGGPEVEPTRVLLSELLTLPGVQEHWAGMISGLGIRYAMGAGEHALLGRRLPDLPLRPRTPGAPRRTTELLRAGNGVLFLLDSDEAVTLAAVAAPWAGRVVVCDAPPAEEVGATAGRALLVRPDGYVGWAGIRPDGLRAALRRWFGTPAPGPGRSGAFTHTPRRR